MKRIDLVAQNSALKARNRELHAENDRLVQESADRLLGSVPADVIAFLTDVAESQSKFAKSARGLLGNV